MIADHLIEHRRRIVDFSSVATDETGIRVEVEVWEIDDDPELDLYGVTTSTYHDDRLLSETTVTNFAPDEDEAGDMSTSDGLGS